MRTFHSITLVSPNTSLALAIHEQSGQFKQITNIFNSIVSNTIHIQLYFISFLYGFGKFLIKKSYLNKLYFMARSWFIFFEFLSTRFLRSKENQKNLALRKQSYWNWSCPSTETIMENRRGIFCSECVHPKLRKKSAAYLRPYIQR